ncbi:hypothetical protein J6590_044624 [Homalodisca vitripennis]|nr:hypothetical protein J6590_044624 [Homalodisca vitripennis]
MAKVSVTAATVNYPVYITANKRFVTTEPWYITAESAEPFYHSKGPWKFTTGYR